MIIFILISLNMLWVLKRIVFSGLLGHVAQSLTCLTAGTCLTADPGVPSSIPVRSHTFLEIDHEIISMVILLPSADSRRGVVSYK